MMESPRQLLSDGVAILAPALEPHGFTFAWGDCGNSSGGQFASGQFNRQSRHLSLHHRFGLGIVTFGVADLIVPHEEYITFLGVIDRSKLLWTPLSSGLDRYQALRFDIEHLCADFTIGDARALEFAARDYATRMHAHSLQFNA